MRVKLGNKNRKNGRRLVGKGLAAKLKSFLFVEFTQAQPMRVHGAHFLKRPRTFAAQSNVCDRVNSIFT